MQLTNMHNVGVALAAWLAYDGYDYNDDPYTISATTLMRPTKQTILAARVPPQDSSEDIVGRVSSAMGTAIHDSIESVWITPEKLEKALTALGWPEKLRKRVLVNPTPEQLKEADKPIPIYVELRGHRKIGKWTISGKMDITVDSEVQDFKSTTAFSYMKGNRVDDYRKQGSIYRWIHRDIITKDTITIHYIIRDYSAAQGYQDNYPPAAAFSKTYELASMAETERFIQSKVNELEQLWDAPEEAMERCSEDDLWMSPPTYKYYKDPAKKARSTKNFDNMADAQTYKASKGKGAGVIDVVYGEARACRYCPAFAVCKQKDEYINSGQLKISL